MIGYLKGTIKRLDETNAIVVVENGVGYDVNIYADNYTENSQVEIYISTIVSSDSIKLWGFLTLSELNTFKQLISVSGVGPKSAQKMIFELGINNIVTAVFNSDYKSLKVPGVGEKTARKIVIDMQGKIAKIETEVDMASDSNLAKREKVILALRSLGYSGQIENKVKKMELDYSKDINAIIKEVLSKYD